jgi:hypothetical protein
MAKLVVALCRPGWEVITIGMAKLVVALCRPGWEVIRWYILQ